MDCLRLLVSVLALVLDSVEYRLELLLRYSHAVAALCLFVSDRVIPGEDPLGSDLEILSSVRLKVRQQGGEGRLGDEPLEIRVSVESDSLQFLFLELRVERSEVPLKERAVFLAQRSQLSGISHQNSVRVSVVQGIETQLQLCGKNWVLNHDGIDS